MHLYRNIIIGLFVLVAPFSESIACSCVPFEVETNYKKSKYVFEAYITEAKLSDDLRKKEGKNSVPWAIGEFEVLKTWKGKPQDLDGVITNSQASACGLSLSPGNAHLFFVYETVSDNGLFLKNEYGIVSTCGSPEFSGYQSLKATRKWLEKHKK